MSNICKKCYLLIILCLQFFLYLSDTLKGKGSPILDFERRAQCLSPVLGHQPLPYISARWPGLSAEPKDTFAVRLLLISLPPSGEYKAESTLWG